MSGGPEFLINVSYDLLQSKFTETRFAYIH